MRIITEYILWGITENSQASSYREGPENRSPVTKVEEELKGATTGSSELFRSIVRRKGEEYLENRDFENNGTIKYYNGIVDK